MADEILTRDEVIEIVNRAATEEDVQPLEVHVFEVSETTEMIINGVPDRFPPGSHLILVLDTLEDKGVFGMTDWKHADPITLYNLVRRTIHHQSLFFK